MEPVSLNIHTAISAGRQAVVYAEGDVDVATSPSLREALAKVLQRCTSVVVDVAAVRVVDSSGLSVLVWAHREAHRLGGSLQIRRPPPRFRRLLEITALDTFFLIDDEATPS